MKKVLVTGINGLLGYDIAKQLIKNNFEVIGIGTKPVCILPNIQYYQIDITNQQDVLKIKQLDPDIIIHCAAYKNMDKAEEQPEFTFKVNYEGTKYLTEIAKENNIVFVYISSESVFSEEKDIIHKAEKIDPNTKSLSVYGLSKLAGENIVSSLLQKYFIIRTHWVFGINGNNFIKMIIQEGKKHTSVNVINDQFGRPTYSVDFAKLIVDMIQTDKYGYYHITNSGEEFINQYEFCKEIYKQIGLNTQIIPISSENYPRKAKRLKNSRLDLSKLTKQNFKQLPDWKDALQRYLKEEKYIE